MKILLIAPQNYDFTFVIQRELQKRGHNVRYIADRSFVLDYYLSYSCIFKRCLKYIIGSSTRQKRNYWNEIFAESGALYSFVPNVLICINGFSLSKRFFELLRQVNPYIKTVYYLWDSCKLYAFDKHFSYFDKCVTFDYLDSKTFGIEYLPMFWVPSDISNVTKKMAFFVGSLHSDRYSVLKSLKPQLEKMGIECFFRLFVPQKSKLYVWIRHYINKLVCHNDVFDEYFKIMFIDYNNDITISEHISLSDFNAKMAESTYVIDIEQPCQTALTPRVVQALAMNKIIISTNTLMKEESFYDKNRIWIIDRHNPDLINIKYSTIPPFSKTINEFVELTSLHNWLDKLIQQH